MLQQFSRETALCISVSARPSNFGIRFHNFLYHELGLNFLYKSCAVENLEDAIHGVRALHIRGCGVSMPFKEKVLDLIDDLDPGAERIGAVNTILNERGRLIGYNTDATAVAGLFGKSALPPASSIALYGTGGMARAILDALRECGFRSCTVFGRNYNAALALANEFGFKAKEAFDSEVFDVLVNATPLGMSPDLTESLPFPSIQITRSQFIVDSVAAPPETRLIQLGKSLGKKVISGFDIVVAQGIEQFALYTGVRPKPDQVARAAEFARGN